MKTLQRIQQSTLGKHPLLEIDLNLLRDNDSFREVSEAAKEAISALPHGSVCVLVNTDSFLFDSETKRIIVEWMAFNEPYIRRTAIIGMDGIKKIMLTGVLKLTGRDNVMILDTRKAALHWLSGGQ